MNRDEALALAAKAQEAFLQGFAAMSQLLAAVTADSPSAGAPAPDLTVEQVAADLGGISKKRIYDMAARREIPALKIGKYWRFPRAEYLRWKERRR